MSASDGVIDSAGNIDWQRLGAIVAGIISIPIFSGFATLIRTVYKTFVIDPLNSLGEYLSLAVFAPFDTAGTAMSMAWHSAGSFVQSFELFGFAIAIAIVAITAYAVARLGVLD